MVTDTPIGDSLDAVVGAWITECRKTSSLHKVTIAEVLDKALKIDPEHQTRSDQTRVAISLRRLGWISRRERVNGTKVTVYTHPGDVRAMPEPVFLHPDENPHAERFLGDLQEVIERHAGRGQMTWAEIIGAIEVVKLEVIKVVDGK